MASNKIKKRLSKGERLGWTPIEEVKSVLITAELMKGQRVRNLRSKTFTDQSTVTSYLIP